MSSYPKLAGALAAIVLLVAACGGGGSATQAPSRAPTSAAATTGAASQAASAAPSAAQSAAASTAPSTEASTEPSTEPSTEASSGPGEPSPTPTPFVLPSPVAACAGGGTGGTLTGTLTLWHSYGSGAGTEADALSQALGVVCAENPGLVVDVVALNFNDLFNVYQQQAADGSPDLFIAPNDSMWKLAEVPVIQNVKDNLDTSKFNQLAIDGSSYTTTGGEEGIWQVPESLKAVALYYNKDTVTTPPASTGDLTSAVQGGTKLGLYGGSNGLYHNFGWWGAFGGKLMDDSGKCIADQGGVADAFKYLQDLKAAGATFYPTYDDMAADFKEGNLDMIVDGPWAAGGYAESVANLGVVAMPAGPAGPALPLTGVDGYNINPYGKNVQLATDFANRMVAPDIEKIYADVAYHIPAGADVPASSNEISAQFADAVQKGYLRPQTPNLDNFWGNFGTAMSQVLDEGADPTTAVADACAAMNSANGL